MQLLLAILLYLRVIFSPGTYTEKQIRTFEEHHKGQIESVKNDKAAMDQVEEIYLPQADHIVIIQSETD